MDLPKFNETFLPILEALKDGNIIKGRDLLRIVEQKFYSDLPKDLLEEKTTTRKEDMSRLPRKVSLPNLRMFLLPTFNLML